MQYSLSHILNICVPLKAPFHCNMQLPYIVQRQRRNIEYACTNLLPNNDTAVPYGGWQDARLEPSTSKQRLSRTYLLADEHIIKPEPHRRTLTNTSHQQLIQQSIAPKPTCLIHASFCTCSISTTPSHRCKRLSNTTYHHNKRIQEGHADT
jgi:hypothetical protein